jgi:hypothetical protein
MTTSSYRTATDEIGALADRLWADEQFAWSQLKHSDWRVRYFSFAALNEAWQLSKDELFTLCKSLILSDPSEVLVINLLCELGNSFQGSYNCVVSAFVANLVRSGVRSNSVRIQAYFSLEDINQETSPFVSEQEIEIGTIDAKLKIVESRMAELDSGSLKVIDWSLVNRYPIEN